MNSSGATAETSLLLTLEEVSQLVSHGHDPHETLGNIVRLIRARFHTAVCSVYWLEHERGELVLAATLGLKPESVGRVRMRLDEGLTGLVAQKMTPVMVDDAFTHPRFKYFPEAGEDLYHSFLGVPLIEGGVVQGVLVVQTPEAHAFSSDETRMLITVGSQLAPLVSGARLLEQVVAATHAEPTDDAAPSPCGPVSLQGTPLSPGTAVGLAYVLNGFSDWLRTMPEASDDPAEERRRLAQAMEAARDDLDRLSQRISALVGEDHGAILQAQLMIMQDRAIEQDLTVCLDAGCSAEAALVQTLDKYVAAFQKLTTPFFQERVYDIKDVFRRLLWHLRPHAQADARGERLVLLAHEASVMDLFSIELDRLAAVVVEHGGPQSHAAILARSLGIPMVGQVHDLFSRLEPGRPVFVDGSAGSVCLNPTQETVQIADYRLSIEEDPSAIGNLPSAIHPGLPRLEANVNLLYELEQAVRQRAGGVGLFRSEFLFLARRTLPTEEEQVGIYRKLLEKLDGRPVSIRTFDLRPDKLAHYSHWTAAANYPFDWRLVLESPPLQKLFKEQVRAILRAATSGPARILIPLVTRTEQLDFVLETVEQARAELSRDGLEYGERVPLGVMLEVAAAAAMVETWAADVDFFALGTNDLIASALGIDRDDPVGASKNDSLHPGFLRLLNNVVEAAHAAKRRVTVCGEMASDPEGVLALAALGVDAVSVPVNQLAAIRNVLAGQAPEELTRLAPGLLGLRTADRVRGLLRALRDTPR